MPVKEIEDGFLNINWDGSCEVPGATCNCKLEGKACSAMTWNCPWEVKALIAGWRAPNVTNPTSANRAW